MGRSKKENRTSSGHDTYEKDRERAAKVYDQDFHTHLENIGPHVRTQQAIRDAERSNSPFKKDLINREKKAAEKPEKDWRKSLDTIHANQGAKYLDKLTLSEERLGHRTRPKESKK